MTGGRGGGDGLPQEAGVRHQGAEGTPPGVEPQEGRKNCQRCATECKWRADVYVSIATHTYTHTHAHTWHTHTYTHAHTHTRDVTEQGTSTDISSVIIHEVVIARWYLTRYDKIIHEGVSKLTRAIKMYA